jgi:hypothetical protein
MKAKGWLISILLSFALGAAFYKQAVAQPSGVVEVPSFNKLSCISESRKATIRRDPKNGVVQALENCQQEINEKLKPLKLTEGEKRIAFLSILAHSMAPYGPSRSILLEDLLSDKSMDCDNYAILTGHFNSIINDKTYEINFVGFDGGAAGNHAQLFINSEKGLLLDPTIGLVARIGFNDLLSGKSMKSNQVIVFRQHTDKQLEFFEKKVYNAILQGKYKPSDLLYFFHSLDNYLRFSDQIGPLWGKDINDLVARFPTPASKALRDNLKTQSSQPIK